jgi:hypothetical protein
MAKVTVYVPDDLAAEAKAEDARIAGIRPSAVYQAALRFELNRLKAQAKVYPEANRLVERWADDQDVFVSRLRGTRSKDALLRMGNGHKDGTRWAREAATLSELREMVGLPEHEMYYNIPAAVLDWVMGFDGEYLDDMWVTNIDRVNQPDHEPQPYWEGFQMGATEVFDVVRLRLVPADEYDIRVVEPHPTGLNPGGPPFDDTGRPMMVWQDPSHGLRAGWVLNYLEQGQESPGVEDYEIGGEIDNPDQAIEEGRAHLRRIRYSVGTESKENQHVEVAQRV